MATTFAEIPAEAISKHTWAETDKMLAHARKELKLPPMKIRWFMRADQLPAGVEGLEGFQHPGNEPFSCLQGQFRGDRPNEVWVRAGRPLSEVLHTLVHELLHAYAYFYSIPYGGQSEQNCDDAADRIIQSYREDLTVYSDHAMGRDYRQEELDRRRRTEAEDQARERVRADARTEAAVDIVDQDWFKEAMKREGETRRSLRVSNKKGRRL